MNDLDELRVELRELGRVDRSSRARRMIEVRKVVDRWPTDEQPELG